LDNLGTFMKRLSTTLACLSVSLTLGIGSAAANTTNNQTDDLSPILPAASLPFQVVIEQTNFQLPVGLHSGVVGVYHGLWVFIAGRINGLHGFGPDPFPPEAQNTSIYVVNPTTGSVTSRSLKDPSAGLNQQQIDTLSVTSPQAYQDGAILYMSGGYGIDTSTGTFSTKPVLTAINLPGIIQWVTNPGIGSNSVINNISQMYDPIFQIAGGKMFRLGNLTQLVFGQNLAGDYTPGSNGVYSEQVRRFQIKNVGGQLSVEIYPSKPQSPDANFRRRDLNILPALLNNNNNLQYSYVAYAGVFTPATGTWTVPVVINDMTNPIMPDPNLPTTFKQAMNHYVCAAASLYSRKYTNMYHIFFGGISYGFYDTNGVFQTDSQLPFINQVTTIQIDKNNNFTQYLMGNQYPTILSTQINPGNTLLFGAGAYFITNNISQYSNTVINLDNIRQPTVIGYIVGGIQSTLPNTNAITDSTASAYIFKVTLTPTVPT
jgi:hypothetical protein